MLGPSTEPQSLSPEELTLAGEIQPFLIEMCNFCAITPENSRSCSQPFPPDLQAKRKKNSLTSPSPHRALFEIITCNLSLVAGGWEVKRGWETKETEWNLSGYSERLFFCLPPGIIPVYFQHQHP
jgi:hypothetical protein